MADMFYFTIALNGEARAFRSNFGYAIQTASRISDSILLQHCSIDSALAWVSEYTAFFNITKKSNNKRQTRLSQFPNCANFKFVRKYISGPQSINVVEQGMSNDAIKLYALELACGKYYIGQTHDVEKRLHKHMNKHINQNARTPASLWTRKYMPIKILEIRLSNATTSSEAMVFENIMTMEYMFAFGWRNVRGGDYLSLDEEIVWRQICANKTYCKPVLNSANKTIEYLYTPNAFFIETP
jgi:predicted GIY-YIG superfamily endonuclease